MAKINLLGRVSRKPCVVKSGPKKGKLKKGWRYNKRGGCVKAKG